MKSFLRQFFSQQRIAGGAMVLAVTSLLSSACGFLRDQAFSVMFPLDSDPLGVASVYIAAFRPSDLLFQLLVMSCLSVVLVPFLAAHLAHGRKEEINRILTSTMLVFGLLFGSVALAMFVAFPWIAPLMVKFTGESLELYVKFGRIALLTNFLFVFGNTLGQYLITKQSYWVYGLTPIIWALGTIVGTYLLTPSLGAMGPIVGTLLGTILYIALRAIAVTRSGYSLTFDRGSFVHPELKEMGFLIFPRMAALGALQLQLLLLDRLASGLGKNMVALNQFASNFESVIPGIVGIALAQSVFSLLSQSAARGESGTFWKHFRKALLFNVLLSVPSAIVLAFCTSIAAWLMRLGPDVTPIFKTSLLIYAIAVPFESANHVILRSFYALKNTGMPALSSIVSCLLAVVTGTLLLPVLGVYALAVAYVSAQVSQTALLGTTLGILVRKRVPGD